MISTNLLLIIAVVVIVIMFMQNNEYLTTTVTTHSEDTKKPIPTWEKILIVFGALVGAILIAFFVAVLLK